jgi:hypothetical protein
MFHSQRYLTHTHSQRYLTHTQHMWRGWTFDTWTFDRCKYLEAFQRAKTSLENLANVRVALTHTLRENLFYICGAAHK